MKHTIYKYFAIRKERITWTMFFFLFAVSSLIFVLSLSAQNVDEIELHYYRAVRETEASSARQDSMQNRINSQIELIRLEKEKSSPDQDRIKRMMADIIEQRRRLKAEQRNAEVLRDQIKKLRDQLQVAYEKTVDSLMERKSKTNDKKELKLLEESIAFIFEKQLILTPVIRPLTFRWVEIDKLSKSESSDSLELRFMLDYIRSALDEIDERIEAMKKARSKYDELIAFHRKLEAFTEDIESPFFSTQNRGTIRYENNIQLGYSEISQSVWITNVHTLKSILRQLNNEIPGQNKRLFAKKGQKINYDETNYEVLNYDDYIELVKLVEKTLVSYRKIIQKKSDALQRSSK